MKNGGHGKPLASGKHRGAESVQDQLRQQKQQQEQQQEQQRQQEHQRSLQNSHNQQIVAVAVGADEVGGQFGQTLFQYVSRLKLFLSVVFLSAVFLSFSVLALVGMNRLGLESYRTGLAVSIVAIAGLTALSVRQLIRIAVGYWHEREIPNPEVFAKVSPRLGPNLFLWLLAPANIYESLLGDLIEAREHRAEQGYGKGMVWTWYWLQILRSIPVLVKYRIHSLRRAMTMRGAFRGD